MNDLPPILVAGLFRELNGHLVRLLGSLSPEDWHRPTVSSERNVKDVASHLLDGSVRRLSLQRDGYAPPDAPTGFSSSQELAAYPHRRGTGRLLRGPRPVRPRPLPGGLGRRGAVGQLVRRGPRA